MGERRETDFRESQGLQEESRLGSPEGDRFGRRRPDVSSGPVKDPRRDKLGKGYADWLGKANFIFGLVDVRLGKTPSRSLGGIGWRLNVRWSSFAGNHRKTDFCFLLRGLQSLAKLF